MKKKQITVCSPTQFVADVLVNIQDSLHCITYKKITVALYPDNVVWEQD